MKTNYDVVVIGGGASGMMASIFASRNGKSVLLLDHNEKLGKKLYITGKGKCNLTNDSSVDNHIAHIINNPKFMYSALNNFTPQDTISFFNSIGLKTRDERGHRVFPESNKSSDVIKVLANELNSLGVKVSLNTDVIGVEKEAGVFKILCNNDIIYTANSVIVACGGESYSATGSTGFGYKIASDFGHKVVDTVPGLCPILVGENLSNLVDLTMKNVRLTIIIGKESFSEVGELQFLSNALLGPIAITLSSLLNRHDLSNAVASLDLKIGLDKEQLNNKFQREFLVRPKEMLYNYLNSVLPHKFVSLFISKLNIKDKQLAQMTKQDREKLITLIKDFRFEIIGLADINTAIITSGGVDVKEISNKTMESKLVDGLYFVGEVLDVDALTGGYNLQIAWSTGKVAGESIK